MAPLDLTPLKTPYLENIDTEVADLLLNQNEISGPIHAAFTEGFATHDLGVAADLIALSSASGNDRSKMR